MVIALILCADHGVSLAASSNGTRFPAQGRIEAGYEYLNMFRRPLGRSYGVLKTRDHFFTLSVGVFDWLSVDGKIGMGDQTATGGAHLPKLEFNDGFAGGYGLRIKVFEHEPSRLKLIFGAQHISVHPCDRSINGDKYETFLDDWQVSGVASSRFKALNPYVGMKLSDCEFVYKINKHDKKRRYSKYHLGFIVGTDLFFFEDRIRINLEGRFFDETALSTGIAYLF